MFVYEVYWMGSVFSLTEVSDLAIFPRSFFAMPYLSYFNCRQFARGAVQSVALLSVCARRGAKCGTFFFVAVSRTTVWSKIGQMNILALFQVRSHTTDSILRFTPTAV